MRSDELIKRVRRSAWIQDVSGWSDITDADILNELNDRALALMSDEIVTRRAGYGLKEYFVTCVAGTQRYAVPDRAIGGGWDTLNLQVPGQTTWLPLKRIEARDVWMYDKGPAAVDFPTHYCVQDGNIELYPSPNAAYVLCWRFYIRPSYLVTSQSSTLGGDGVVRGLVTAVNPTLRQVSVNVVPFDQLLGTPAAITSGNQQIDIIRPRGTFPCTMFSVTQTLAGVVFTLGGTQDMTDVAIGDYVRVAEQTDWPSNIPVEFHRMLADRAAMEVLREIGLEEKQQQLALTVKADLDRFRSVCSPQVKSQPKRIGVGLITQQTSRGRYWRP